MVKNTLNKGLRKKRKLNRVTAYDVIVMALVVLITVIIAYPLWFVIVASVSPADDVASGKTLLWFSKFTLDAYKNVFQEERIWIGYRNTIFYTVVGTLYNLALTLPAAYAMTKKQIPFHGLISWFFFLTMFISGGLIPSFLLRKELNLYNTPWVMIITMGVSCYNLIICRQYFSNNIPGELRDAAYMDGCGDIKTFLKIYIPLSKPIIAVLALYCAVGKWNDYMSGVIYLQNQDYYTLQQMIQIVTQQGVNVEQLFEDPSLDAESISAIMDRYYLARTMKYAIVFVGCAPLLIAYPFVQKYFVKGVMIGSVKG